MEKGRVNPGNYADKKKFEQIDYTDASYQNELERIEKKFMPLVRICKEYGTAMRIGTNHGSLSDRILSRYGDTPQGMVESAMEFLRICEKENYHQIVLSMKASNTLVMVQAYRLLVNQMLKEGMNYPLHLGVTEAGDGEDGRVKSAVGIGTLLEDGLGDTIRVSLTEVPEAEIPVAEELANRYKERASEPIDDFKSVQVNPFKYQRRITASVQNIGDHHVPVVMADLSLKKDIKPANLFGLGYRYSVTNDKWTLSDSACDYLFVANNLVDFELPGTLSIVQMYKGWSYQKNKKGHYPWLDKTEYLSDCERSENLNFVYACTTDLDQELLNKIKNDATAVMVIDTYNPHGMK